MEAMHKQVEIFRKYSADIYRYAGHLESLLDDCRRQFYHPNVDYRATRPPDFDILLGQEEDSDVMMMVEPFTQHSRFPALAENPDDTYVLLVDGVQSSDSSHYNPTLDWSRHLPSNVPLDRPSHDKFVLIFQLTILMLITYSTGH